MSVELEAQADHRPWQANEHWPVTPADVIEADDDYMALADAHEMAERLYGFGSAEEQAASAAVDAYLGIQTPEPCCCDWAHGMVCRHCPDHRRWAARGWDCAEHNPAGGAAA
ncbi:MAG: hypothetical protein KIT69_09465 [Propionibacteriaceae bacterium]|nr:hypothetical protein [Propionibacteriaceae bacterium]